MTTNVPDPTNEFLDAWSAEWLGLVERTVFDGHIYHYYHNLETGKDILMEDWRPTAEGSESQAIMVAKKFLGNNAHFRFEIAIYPGMTHVGVERIEPGSVLIQLGFAQGNFGRAIVLAAWRAVEGEK